MDKITANSDYSNKAQFCQRLHIQSVKESCNNTTVAKEDQ